MSMEGTVSWVGLSLLFLRREKDQQAVNALLLLWVGDGSYHMTSTLGAQCCSTLRADPGLGGGSSLSFPSEISHSPSPPSFSPLDKYFRGYDLPIGTLAFRKALLNT